MSDSVYKEDSLSNNVDTMNNIFLSCFSHSNRALVRNLPKKIEKQVRIRWLSKASLRCFLFGKCYVKTNTTTRCWTLGRENLSDLLWFFTYHAPSRANGRSRFASQHTPVCAVVFGQFFGKNSPGRLPLIFDNTRLGLFCAFH